MTLREIARHPTSESTRSYHTLKQVKDWLTRGVPGDVILELMEEIEEMGADTERPTLLRGSKRPPARATVVLGERVEIWSPPYA